jgi:quercetin dioxygenase-like cupin family protein
MIFSKGGETEHWTMDYEEVLYVVEGSLTLSVSAGDEQYTVVGEPATS